MSMIDDIKRDREAGTPGATAVWGHHTPGFFTVAQCYADAARRARVPDLEAAYLALAARVKAADELAEASDRLARFAFSHMTGGRQDLVDNTAAALAAYRAAVGASE